MKTENSPTFYAGPYTCDVLHAAPLFAVFKGPAPDVKPGRWEIFELDGCTHGDTEHASEVTGLSVLDSEPERDDDACDGDPSFDDVDAALAYLRNGGALCKVPDHDGSKYYRFLVVDESVAA
jgi:hypothetical protein